MARTPSWTDAGDDPHAVAGLLSQAAEEEVREWAPTKRQGDPVVLHQAALLVARERLARSHGEADRLLAQEVRAIDDLVRAANLLVERLREWYALHAPEATRAVADAEQLARLVAEHGDRTAVMAAIDQADGAATSLGTDLDDADMAVLQSFAQALQGVHEAWRGAERRVEESMHELAPNLESVVGPVLGARLIAQAGSLQRLATMTSGTVQTLGAETALFRHIKEGTKPPKHGILFQHPKVHQALPWQRGSMARALALHATTASRADAFTQNDLRAYLQESIQKDFARIARTKAKAPKRSFPPRDQGGRSGGGGPRRSYGGGKGPGGTGSRDPRGGGGSPGRSGRPYGTGGGGRGPPGKHTGGPKKKRRDYGSGPAKPPGGGR